MSDYRLIFIDTNFKSQKMYVSSEEEFLCHPCLGKSKSHTISSGSSEYSVNYYVCREDCDGKLPKCIHAIRARCSADSEGPTCVEIARIFIDQIMETKPPGFKRYKEIISLYVDSCLGRQWHCEGCKYWERNDGKGTAFSTTHGVNKLLDDAVDFCEYFLIRKCFSSDSYRQAAANCMTALLVFCVDKFGYNKDDAKDKIDSLKVCKNFQGEKICRELAKLKSEGYWDSLREDVVSVGSKRPLDDKDHEDDDESVVSNDMNDYESVWHDEMGMRVININNEGWLFHDGRRRSINTHESDDESIPLKLPANESVPSILLKLPAKVRKLGRKGMSISCMGLGLRKGIWSPFNYYNSDDDYVCANVYPT